MCINQGEVPVNQESEDQFNRKVYDKRIKDIKLNNSFDEFCDCQEHCQVCPIIVNDLGVFHNDNPCEVTYDLIKLCQNLHRKANS